MKAIDCLMVVKGLVVLADSIAKESLVEDACCNDCTYKDLQSTEYPCNECNHNYVDMYERVK